MHEVVVDSTLLLQNIIILLLFTTKNWWSFVPAVYHVQCESKRFSPLGFLKFFLNG